MWVEGVEGVEVRTQDLQLPNPTSSPGRGPSVPSFGPRRTRSTRARRPDASSPPWRRFAGPTRSVAFRCFHRSSRSRAGEHRARSGRSRAGTGPTASPRRPTPSGSFGGHWMGPPRRAEIGSSTRGTQRTESGPTASSASKRRPPRTLQTRRLLGAGSTVSAMRSGPASCGSRQRSCTRPTGGVSAARWWESESRGRWGTSGSSPWWPTGIPRIREGGRSSTGSPTSPGWGWRSTLRAARLDLPGRPTRDEAVGAGARTRQAEQPPSEVPADRDWASGRRRDSQTTSDPHLHQGKKRSISHPFLRAPSLRPGAWTALCDARSLDARSPSDMPHRRRSAGDRVRSPVLPP